MKPNIQSHFKFTLIVAVLVLAVSAGGLIPKSAYAAPGDLYVPDLTDVTNLIYAFTPDGTPRTFATIGSPPPLTGFLAWRSTAEAISLHRS